MAKYFGTDGIRALAGSYPLVEDFVFKLGFAAMEEIIKAEKTLMAQEGCLTVVIGRDSRKSGEEITRWISAGAVKAGCKVVDIGIASTPAVACVAKHLNALCAVVVSASHNPPDFNGIKFFNREGRKLPQETETKIEQNLEQNFDKLPSFEKACDGMIEFNPGLLSVYEDFITGTMPKDVNLKGKTIVLDTANGAAYKTAAQVLRKLNATVISIFDKPNGCNINDNCGALHTGEMRRKVVENKAWCGISLDGDADRVIFSDENGRELDGDDLMFIAACSLKKKGALKNNKVVLTIMSNYGLISKLKEAGIESMLVDVGDKYVSKALDDENLTLGGESSGHIIFHDFAPSGDGLLSAVQVLSLLIEAGKQPGYFKDLWSRYPHVLKAVKVERKVPLNEITGFNQYIKKREEEMKGNGRILVRYSGTEPKLRILVEGKDSAQNEEIASMIEQEYRQCVNGGIVCQN